MSSVERYRKEWEQILEDLKQNSERIRDRAFNSELKNSKLRSVHWAILLRVLSADYTNWIEQRQQQRMRYEKLKHEFVKNPYDAQKPNDDPLSQSKQSVWNQYFNDQELFAVIRQDVVRTFPGVEFFRKPLVQDAMTNILFCYSREHPYMSYRQGMHEIVSPILFVLYSDHQSLLHLKDIAAYEIDPILLNVINPEYLEADSYSIFSRLMSSIESYYRVANVSRFENFDAQNKKPSISAPEVEIIGHLNQIRDKILAKEDLHLHNYLQELDIPLHIFGIRWLRLLFGREFTLLDLLFIWDAIFADSDRFDLPNYILVAMLIRIRDKLLLNDYTNCLTYLMRYPTNVDVNLILRHALHMQMPKKFDCPPNAFVYFTMNPTNSVTKKEDSNYFSNKTTSTTKISKSNNANPNTYTNLTNATFAQQTKQRGRSTSLVNTAAATAITTATTNVDEQIARQQTHNAVHSANVAKIQVGVTDFSRAVMEGYSKDSPELLRLEVKNAQTIIKIARKKLHTYVGVIRKHVHKNSSDELLNALDGIEELSTLLDVNLMFPLHISAMPIDAAMEANEQQKQLKVQRTTSATIATAAAAVEIPTIHQAQTHMQTGANAFAISKATEPQEYLSDTSLEIDQISMNLNQHHPHTTTHLKDNSNAKLSYEKPDETFMFNSKRVLGNLKDIELIPITADEKPILPMELIKHLPNPQINERS